MANSAIAIDRLEALEIALNLAAKIAFDEDLIRGDRLNDVIELLRREALRPDIRVDIGLLEHFLCEARPDPVNVREGSFDPFITGDFYAEKTRHILAISKLTSRSGSALALLVARVLADHANDAVSLDHAAVFAKAFY